ncbi:hypothetical protein ASPTUDRAFT_35586 [Aspergillus tubingensis CBS 134.48]|uniref:Protein kinase domain-containing protein n=1 Tax=Aspergillus tubingensis (strain CBS 134.48) TaxID=767770 RepID=A0A1L9NH35_ASPTC|nr:hypothetical protein ASPTUDRAFT_35586 [Aspergillus tubingensis CBS 134.48]
MASSIYRHKPLFDTRLDFEFGAWKVGRNLSSKIRKQEDPQGGFMYERHEVYEATRVDQPSNTPDVIKIKKQITFWSNHRYSEPSDGVYREIYNLSQLEDCRRIPKLLGDELPGGYNAYIVMQKVPGENLHFFDTLRKEEQNRIRIAFIEALWELQSRHFTHWDPRRENIMWELQSGQCSIVNLENAEKHTERTKDDVCLDAMEQLEYWGLFEGQYEGVLFFEKDKLLLEDLKFRLYIK